jgi:phosphoglycolate phosphatase-like HAD superfamily hydrolase
MKLRSAGIVSDEIPAAFCDDGHSREEVVQTARDRAVAHKKVEAFERVVSIGDGIWDLTTARRLELPFVGVCAAGGDRLHSRGASHVVRDLTDVQALLRCLEEADVPRSRSL